MITITDQQIEDLIADAEVESIPDAEYPNYHVSEMQDARPTASSRIIYVGDGGDQFYQAPIDIDRLREGILKLLKG